MLNLGDAEIERLIDKVILIGVPQSGAPQALAALLYGYEEGIPTRFPGIVSTHVARTLAENSPMAYHLLPSTKYFEAVDDPDHAVVTFKGGEAYDVERNVYGETIDTFSELASFAMAEEGGREKPIATRIDQANVLNLSLLTYAQDTHDAIDAWTPPVGIEVHQIAGWGVTTLTGIEYYQKCMLTLCASLYRPTLIEEGDGVVPIPSALMLDETNRVERYWINLDAYGLGPIGKKGHGNLLTIGDVRSLVTNILTQDEPSLPSNIYGEQLRDDNLEKKLIFFLHSPLTLELHDAHGNRVGPNEDGTIDEEIADADYGVLGDVQYIIVPAEEEYELEMRGYDSGTFTLEVSEIEGGKTTSEIAFVEVPVTSDTIARMDIHSDFSSEHILGIDNNGDGEIDMILSEGGQGISSEEEPEMNTQKKKSSRRVDLDAVHGNSLEQLQVRLYRLLLELFLHYLQEAQSS